jgi:hypothetical protein
MGRLAAALGTLLVADGSIRAQPAESPPHDAGAPAPAAQTVQLDVATRQQTPKREYDHELTATHVILGEGWGCAQDPRPPASPPVPASSLPTPSPATPSPPAPPPAVAGSAEPLSKAAVIGGMDAVKPAVMRCSDRFRVRGVVTVNVVIERDGSVGRAAAVGSFVGTPTGACVEAAVKSARFPPSQGLTTPYPYRLE